MEKSLLPAETLTDYMAERGYELRDIAERAESSLRSVQRWVKYGIPRTKWTVLQLKENSGS